MFYVGLFCLLFLLFVDFGFELGWSAVAVRVGVMPKGEILYGGGSEILVIFLYLGSREIRSIFGCWNGLADGSEQSIKHTPFTPCHLVFQGREDISRRFTHIFKIICLSIFFLAIACKLYCEGKIHIKC